MIVLERQTSEGSDLDEGVTAKRLRNSAQGCRVFAATLGKRLEWFLNPNGVVSLSEHATSRFESAMLTINKKRRRLRMDSGRTAPTFERDKHLAKELSRNPVGVAVMSLTRSQGSREKRGNPGLCYITASR